MSSNRSNSRRRKLINLLLLFLVFLFVGFFMSYREELKYSENVTCPIFYSESSCINNGLEIWFYNPNNISASSIRIIVPTSRGKDIYNVKEPLPPLALKKLRLNYCYSERSLKDFMLEWCCDDKCFKVKMNNPVNFSKLFNSTPSWEPRSVEDCDLITDEIKRLFCISDVAEITGNISLCYEIKNPDIFYHCIARISLDESKCELIVDKDLKEACKESINLKKKFLGISE